MLDTIFLLAIEGLKPNSVVQLTIAARVRLANKQSQSEKLARQEKGKWLPVFRCQAPGAGVATDNDVYAVLSVIL